MLYTSYFAMIKKFPPNLEPVSISLYPPKGYVGRQIKSLAPSKELLNDYKYGDGSQAEKEAHYIKSYNNFLQRYVTGDWFKKGITQPGYFPATADGKPIWESETNHVALCCFEKTGDFCHRNLLATHLRNEGIPIHELSRSDLENIIDASRRREK